MYAEERKITIVELTDADKRPFQLTPVHKATIAQNLSKEPVSVAGLAMKFNAVIDGKTTKLLSAKALEEALIQAGYFTYSTSNDGKICKTPTEKGEIAGVICREKKLAGGGTLVENLLTHEMQLAVLLHIHGLLGMDGALDSALPDLAQNTTSSAKPLPNLSTQKSKSSHFRFCWNCEAKIQTSLLFTCPVCGWPICPKCGACKHPQSGGCRETKKGLSRFSGIFKDKNDTRAILYNHGLLDREMFSELKSVETHRDLAEFRSRYASAFSQIEEKRKAKREEKQAEEMEKIKERKRNQRGYYRVVSVNGRFITYITADGVKKTIQNRPPVRLGTEYVDLSGLDVTLR